MTELDLARVVEAQAQKSGSFVCGTGIVAMPISEFGFSAQLAPSIGPSAENLGRQMGTQGVRV
jgi:hypothetical protein